MEEQRSLPLLARFPESKLDALLISHAPNVRYLTGYTGSNGLLLLDAGGRGILFTDPRYAIQAAREATCKAQRVRRAPPDKPGTGSRRTPFCAYSLEVKVVRGPLLGAAAKVIGAKRLRRIGFEMAHLSWADHALLSKELPLKTALEPVSGWVEQQRMIKSAVEIEAIRRSVLLNSQAFANTVKKVRPGLRESEVAAELEYQMRRLGAEKPAFETIVASGERTALPHARPTANQLASNELLLIDMGASVEGYCSDMTRMAFLGRPGSKIKSMYGAVLEAQLAAIDAVRENVTAERVDRAARQVLKRHGFDKAFVHSAGHGLGLEIHEPPRLGKRDKTPIKAGMVVTIEPGIYLEGVGGIRIEDTLLVTRTGCEVLTPTSKDLLSL
ncbi:MAG: Xaa-Pro peptidase family protein [Bryobacteraceae bacterium]